MPVEKGRGAAPDLTGLRDEVLQNFRNRKESDTIASLGAFFDAANVETNLGIWQQMQAAWQFEDEAHIGKITQDVIDARAKQGFGNPLNLGAAEVG